MVIVKIKKSSIKKNPDYGSYGAMRYIQGPATVTATYRGIPPKSILKKCTVLSRTAPIKEDPEYELMINEDHENTIQKLIKTKKASVTVDHAMIDVTCKDNGSEYLYSYHNPFIPCSECGHKLRLNSIPQDYIIDEDGEEHQVDKCPKCEEFDSFNYQYQSINEVI